MRRRYVYVLHSLYEDLGVAQLVEELSVVSKNEVKHRAHRFVSIFSECSLDD